MTMQLHISSVLSPHVALASPIWDLHVHLQQGQGYSADGSVAAAVLLLCVFLKGVQ